MFFAFGFVLLPTMALTSPMLDELLNYPADTTGYMFAVGTLIAERPPHRSVRAGFPHTAPTLGV
jgi:hypothetical protein